MALLGALALAACGGDDEDASSDTADAGLAVAPVEAPSAERAADATAPAGDEPASVESTGSTAGSSAPSAPLGLDAYGRAVAVEAGIVIGAANVRAAVDDTLDIVAANSGDVYSADVNIGTTYDDGSVDGSGRIVVKVPPEHLDAMIAELDGAAGVLLARTQSSDDVTDQLVDLDIRIEVERATIAQFERLLGEATAFADIVTIQQTLSTHTIALEQLLAQQRNTNQRVELSTLTIEVRYVSPEAAEVEPASDGDDGVVDALRSGWDAFAAVVMVAVLTIAVSLPFLLVGLAVGGIVWLIARRSSRAGRPRTDEHAVATPLSAPTTEDELVGTSHEG